MSTTKQGANMGYCFTKQWEGSFEAALERVTESLKEQGFGILTEIDIQATLKKKLDVDFYAYRILGACNPEFAYKALQSEDKIGVFLPCNIVVQQKQKDGVVEVSAVDPVASMQSVQNEALGKLALEVRSRMEKVIKGL
jgi:uncharacterized protein (DUF302 family)